MYQKRMANEEQTMRLERSLVELMLDDMNWQLYLALRAKGHFQQNNDEKGDEDAKDNS